MRQREAWVDFPQSPFTGSPLDDREGSESAGSDETIAPPGQATAR